MFKWFRRPYIYNKSEYNVVHVYVYVYAQSIVYMYMYQTFHHTSHGSDTRIVGRSYLHCVPVVVSGGDAVQNIEEEGGL